MNGWNNGWNIYDIHGKLLDHARTYDEAMALTEHLRLKRVQVGFVLAC